MKRVTLTEKWLIGFTLVETGVVIKKNNNLVVKIAFILYWCILDLVDYNAFTDS